MFQLYTLNDVSQHNGKNGAKTWIIIRDIVYDVTDYLDDHPGGADLILEGAGKDCTKEFENIGHSGDAAKLLKKFRIGELVEEDKRANRKKNSAVINADANERKVVKKERRRFRFFFCA